MTTQSRNQREGRYMGKSRFIGYHPKNRHVRNKELSKGPRSLKALAAILDQWLKKRHPSQARELV